MKLHFYLFIIFFLLVSASANVMAQGCVAVKNMSGCSLNWGGEEQHKGWQLSLNYRYFRSYKHFKGKEEQKERVREGTQVINNDNSINLGATYTFNSKWSTAIFIPYIFIDRSSLYEHLGNSLETNPNHERFHTQSAGVGDIRAIAYYNALSKYRNGALLVGAGFKLPTGNYHVKDQFHTADGIVTKYVDQSIQLGDGGFGFIAEVDFNHKIAGAFQGYFNAMYMSNPRNTNGVLRSATLTQDIPKSNEMSVPDQYMVRTGARAAVNNFLFGLGGRVECVPVRDLIGKNEGFRRPGYIVSAEPSAFYHYGPHTFGLSFPVALERKRTQSVLDKERTLRSATRQNGDAAFADWLLSVTYACKISK
jgi:hypothetical protein